MCYTFENRCLEEPGMPLGDEARRIFLYSKGSIGAKKELADLLHYIESSREENAVSETTKKLHQIVEKIRNKREVGVRYLKAIEYENMIRERATREGHENGMKEGLKEGMKEGMKQGRQEGMKQGRQEGMKEGVKAFIINNLEENIPRKRTIEKLQRHFKLTKEEAEAYYIKYSKNETT